MSTDPHLLSIATAVPRYVLRRDDVVTRARHIFAGRAADIERLLPAYVNAGIDTRYSCVPIEWYERPSGWKERSRLYVDNALALCEEVVADCLRSADMAAADIDILVTVSTTGIATPSLDARLLERLGMRRDVLRLPVFGLGCAGGVLGLARAGAMARAHPGARVMLAVVELCGLTFRVHDMSKSNIIATALFGDGAAAVLLGPGHGPRLTSWGEHTWNGSLDVMGWHIEDDGFGVLFSRDIPALIRADFRPVVDAFLDDHGLRLGDIDGMICHPGGAKVVAALEEALELPPGRLSPEREVLRRYGNMSAATILFVLRDALLAGRRGRQMLSGLGPGFTAGFALLNVP